MIALLADASVAADHAALSLPEIDIGIPTFSGFSIVEAIAGRALARDLVQTGRRLAAADAATRGLFTESVPADQLRDVARSRALLLGGKPQAVFAEIKRWSNRGLRAALDEARLEHARHRAAS
jgi:enoyl-CoA hydratase/carnithine racemase